MRGHISRLGRLSLYSTEEDDREWIIRTEVDDNVKMVTLTEDEMMEIATVALLYILGDVVPRTKPFEPVQTLKYLDLSTAHLPQKVMNRLVRDNRDVIAYEYDEGAFLPVVDDAEDSTYRSFPKELLRIMRYARNLGCDLIRFDRDADVNPDLPTYSWS